MEKKSTVTLSFDVDAELLVGVNRLPELLGFAVGESGITVRAVLGDRLGVTLKENVATIYYTKKNQFFRELGVLVEHARKETSFEIEEDGFFHGISAMIDTSRCGVPTVASVCEMIDYLAVMGYDMVMLYTEDTVHLENRPYFGYMRGRYELSDLRAIDDHAFEYGIEVIPCLECYGHMGKYLIWKEARPIKDTADVLLAREPATFEFLEELISAVSSCFRSKRIHIGMDEAWDMGRGKFLDLHGYVPAFQIFNEYMKELIKITDKYGLTPMMWSDMYYRNCPGVGGYVARDVTLPDEIKNEIPDGVELIFWHYGEVHHCDGYMLKSHKETGHPVIFAGGLWGWIGHFPEHNYAMDTLKFSLDACRENDVREAMITIWTNDNAECDLFANLFGLSYFAEMCYDENVSREKLRDRFEATAGGSYDAFYAMSFYHNTFKGDEDYSKYSDRFLGKHLFWQDVMEGMFDAYLWEKPMSGHYADSAALMKQHKGGKWDYLYRFAELVFDYLATKTEIAEKLVPAYKAGDKETLAEIALGLLPLLKEKTVAVHKAHKAMWMSNRTMIGWCNMDVRYAGVVARCDTAIELLTRYLDGTDSVIDSLEEEHLPRRYGGFDHYSHIATPNIKT